MKDLISEFGLTFKQTCILFSLERKLIVDDIVSSIANDKLEEAAKKQAWLSTWDVSIKNL